MNILLTNDDGISAPGIWAAAQALTALGQVTVVAPAGNYSGYSAALPPSRSVSFFSYQHPEGCPANVTAFGLSGTPAGCVHVGLSGAFGGPFDFVVSGINHGANLGRDVFYSGTVGAALTAHLMGIPAVAISLAAGATGVMHWDTAASALNEIVQLCQTHPEPAPIILNVNVPNLPRKRLAGTLLTAPAYDSCLAKYRFEPDPHLTNTLSVQRQNTAGPEPQPWTDAWAIALGYVAISPFQALPDLLCVVPWGVPAETFALPMLTATEISA